MERLHLLAPGQLAAGIYTEVHLNNEGELIIVPEPGPASDHYGSVTGHHSFTDSYRPYKQESPQIATFVEVSDRLGISTTTLVAKGIMLSNESGGMFMRMQVSYGNHPPGDWIVAMGEETKKLGIRQFQIEGVDFHLGSRSGHEPVLIDVEKYSSIVDIQMGDITSQISAETRNPTASSGLLTQARLTATWKQVDTAMRRTHVVDARVEYAETNLHQPIYEALGSSPETRLDINWDGHMLRFQGRHQIDLENHRIAINLSSR